MSKILSGIKNNIYPAIALMIIPCGYFIGTELREINDMKKAIVQSPEETEQDIERLKQQLEALKEEREMVLSKINK
ncbi:hypothetical protein [Parasitella parasitica]|uniref:Uncharacterized protein n=1 Tax=Parasitella parasitica TaxID=35722 RepID=A0A0B7MY99_9FUNG|nr:hypothetical protein [Parasitella parasitica]